MKRYEVTMIDPETGRRTRTNHETFGDWLDRNDDFSGYPNMVIIVYDRQQKKVVALLSGEGDLDRNNQIELDPKIV